MIQYRQYCKPLDGIRGRRSRRLNSTWNLWASISSPLCLWSRTCHDMWSGQSSSYTTWNNLLTRSSANASDKLNWTSGTACHSPHWLRGFTLPRSSSHCLIWPKQHMRPTLRRGYPLHFDAVGHYMESKSEPCTTCAPVMTGCHAISWSRGSVRIPSQWTPHQMKRAHRRLPSSLAGNTRMVGCLLFTHT